MKRILVDVKNNSNHKVARGGWVFPPLSTTTIKISEYQLKEITACIYLDAKISEEEKDEFSCPYCNDYVGKNKQALMAHVRHSHEENYEEFKERVK